MKLKLSLLAIVAMLLFVPLSRAENCNSTVIDKAGVVHSPAIIINAARTLINQGADVHVVFVDTVSKYGGNLAAVETYFEQSCPNWVNSSGQRKENLFVVMVAPTERAKNMFLGSYYSGAFDIAPTYSRLANSFFKSGNWEDGVAATLQGTTNLALSFRQRNFAAQQRVPQQSQSQHPFGSPPAGQPRNTTDDSGMSGLAIFFIVLLVLSGIGVALYFIFREAEPSGTTSYDPAVNESNASYPATPYRSSRSYAAAAPSHTTVINNNSGSGDGLLTGIVVGEMLSRPSTVYVEPSAPVYVEPSYTPSEPAPSSAPDSTWEAPSSTPDTDFGSSDSGSSSSDSSFGGDSGGSSDSSF